MRRLCLSFGKTAPDAVPQGVDMSVDDRLNLAVALGGNDRGDLSRSQVVADEVGVIALTGEQNARTWAGLVHDRSVALHVGNLSAAQRDRDGEAHSVAAEMDLGREGTSRTPKTLVLIPFLSASAACWWARKMAEAPCAQAVSARQLLGPPERTIGRPVTRHDLAILGGERMTFSASASAKGRQRYFVISVAFSGAETVFRRQKQTQLLPICQKLTEAKTDRGKKRRPLVEPPLVVQGNLASLAPDAITISIKVRPLSRITSSYRRRSGRPSRRAVCERPAARRCRAETLATRGR